MGIRLISEKYSRKHQYRCNNCDTVFHNTWDGLTFFSSKSNHNCKGCGDELLISEEVIRTDTTPIIDKREFVEEIEWRE